MSNQCPGKEGFLKAARDLSAESYRRLVGRRGRQLLGAAVGPVSNEKLRRQVEKKLDSHFEKIHLGRDFLPASFLADGASRAQAVCRISTPTSLGTGFLVAPGILMTNNHVLEDLATAADSTAEFGFEAGKNATLAAIEPSRLFITNEALDFTIVACDATPLDGIEPIALLREPAGAIRNERVNVIQHPSGRRKEVALHDNRVERVLDTVIRYRTDTEPGSSGSPVFNNQWQLVALHHAGFAEDGGQAQNEGIRISAIINQLLSSSSESAARSEAFDELLATLDHSTPNFGFFDLAGLRPDDGREVQVDSHQGTPDFADIGVWNIEHFNDRISDRRLEDVADVIERLSMDVLGLVEVQRGAMERLVENLGRRGLATGFALLDVSGSQDLAVLFDRDTTTVELRPDLAERHQERLAARTDNGRSAFPRAPLFADCRVADELHGEVRFLMMVVHLKAFGDPQSRARRRLAAQMLSEIVADVQTSEGLPVVLTGDFNERLTTDVLDPLSDAQDLFALTADDAQTDAISFVGNRHRSLIDHIIVSRDAVLGEISGDDAAIVRLDRSVRDFSDRVSDHVPIVLRLIFHPSAADQPPADDALPSRPTANGNGQQVFHIPLPAGAEGIRLEFEGARESTVVELG